MITETDTQPAPEAETITQEPDVGFLFIIEEFSVLDEHDTGGPLTPPRPPRPPDRRDYWGGRGNDRFWRAIIWMVFIVLALAAGGLLGEVANAVLKRQHEG
jgi:hypothetical protein